MFFVLVGPMRTETIYSLIALSVLEFGTICRLIGLGGDDILSSTSGAKRSFGRTGFMEVVLTACWNIWKVRNDKIFMFERPSFRVWKFRFLHDLQQHLCRFPEKQSVTVKDWLDSLP